MGDAECQSDWQAQLQLAIEIDSRVVVEKEREMAREKPSVSYAFLLLWCT